MIEWADLKVEIGYYDYLMGIHPVIDGVLAIDHSAGMIQAVSKWMFPAEGTTIMVGAVPVEGTIYI